MIEDTSWDPPSSLPLLMVVPARLSSLPSTSPSSTTAPPPSPPPPPRPFSRGTRSEARHGSTASRARRRWPGLVLRGGTSCDVGKGVGRRHGGRGLAGGSGAAGAQQSPLAARA